MRRHGSQTIDVGFTLRAVFGLQTFRGIQKEAIEAALNGRDVFILAPTGLGKSLCFQLPAVAAEHGITIVISPLIALMSNQVESLRRRRVNAASLNSTITSGERERIMDDLACGHPRTRLLYVTPELCATSRFRDRLRAIHEHGELLRFVVDEAHCVSEWGHDFRKDYARLSYLREEFPSVPIMALTATASLAVQKDITEILRLPAPPELALFVSSFNRPNIHYEVRFANTDTDRYADLKRIIQRIYMRRKQRLSKIPQGEAGSGERWNGVSGIIYAHRRSTCDDIAQRLCHDGIAARPYHAGLNTAYREETMAGWVKCKEGYDVIVATIAFGMGVDSPAVRFVIHYDLPKSFEGYYQETGRAGRDGKFSRCILYYSREERDRRLQLLASKRLGRTDSEETMSDTRSEPSGMHPERRFSARRSDKPPEKQDERQAFERRSFQGLVSFCESEQCRHVSICAYFGETIALSKETCDFACDYCKDARKVASMKELYLTPPEVVSDTDNEGELPDDRSPPDEPKEAPTNRSKPRSHRRCPEPAAEKPPEDTARVLQELPPNAVLQEGTKKTEYAKLPIYSFLQYSPAITIPQATRVGILRKLIECAQHLLPHHLLAAQGSERKIADQEHLQEEFRDAVGSTLSRTHGVLLAHQIARLEKGIAVKAKTPAYYLHEGTKLAKALDCTQRHFSEQPIWAHILATLREPAAI